MTASRPVANTDQPLLPPHDVLFDTILRRLLILCRKPSEEPEESRHVTISTAMLKDGETLV